MTEGTALFFATELGAPELNFLEWALEFKSNLLVFKCKDDDCERFKF